MADSLFNSVSLLLPLDGPAGSATFRDHSANHHVVTAVGNTSAKAVGKHNGSSAYFDGAGDYLTVPDSATFDFGTGDFTVELYVRFVSHTTVMTLTGNYLNGGTGWALQYRGDSGILRFGNGDAALLDAAWVPANDVWYHVAVTRAGPALKAFVDGVQIGATATNSADITGSTALLVLGALNFGGYIQNFNGHLSDLRITKGAARYTGTFTPPNGPLRHSLDPNVVLRLTFDDLFDHSQIGSAITAFDNAAVSAAQVKYGAKSLYLDGTGDYITAPTGTAFALGTGDFTVEMWIRPSTTAGITIIYDSRLGSAGSPGGISMCIATGVFRIDVASMTLMTGGAITANVWQHIALTRSAGVFKSWINGAQVATATAAHNLSDGVMCVGQHGGFFFAGYIDDLTITRRAKYTAAFTPPSEALPTATNSDEYLSSVVLRLQMDGANASTTFTDSSPTPKTVTAVGNAQLSTAQSRFGGAAAYFDGTGDALTVPNSASFELGAADFTFECWVNTTTTLAYTSIVGKDTGTFPAGAWAILLNGAGSGSIQLWNSSYTPGAVMLSAPSAAVNDGLWHHIALTRSGSTWTLFKDGVSIASLAWAGTVAALEVPLSIGRDQGYARDFNGYIDDLRITKGVARYV